MGYFKALERPSSFRKLAAAMWHEPNDPHIFGFVDLDMTPMQAFMDRYAERLGSKVTITHVVTRALAMTFARFPALNCKVGWARLLQRPTVDIFCQVATDSGRDLSGFKLPNVDSLGLKDIAAKLSRSASDIREDRDPSFKRSRGLFNALPLWALRIVLVFMDFMSNRLNLHLPGLGMPRDPFGSAMVTSVGMLGVDSGFAPFTPIARCPIILTVTRVKQRPWVVDGQVVARPVLRLCGTFDHRVIDGYHAGEVCTEVERIFAEPERLLTDDERAAWT